MAIAVHVKRTPMGGEIQKAEKRPTGKPEVLAEYTNTPLITSYCPFYKKVVISLIHPHPSPPLDNATLQKEIGKFALHSQLQS